MTCGLMAIAFYLECERHKTHQILLRHNFRIQLPDVLIIRNINCADLWITEESYPWNVHNSDGLLFNMNRIFHSSD